MRYGIFSDIHGNLEALEAIIDAFKNEHIDVYLSCGDIVGYGANPHECIEIVKALPAQTIAGNHDWAVIDKADLNDFNEVAQQAIDWTKRQINKADREFLEQLDLVFRNDHLIIVHGTLKDPERFDYLIYGHQAEEMLGALDRPVCFVGHTHIPMMIKGREGPFDPNSELENNPLFEGSRSEIFHPLGEALTIDQRFLNRSWGFEVLETAEIKIGSAEKVIVNVGSVGQPRDKNPMACYCVYDHQTQVIQVKRVSYNIPLAQQKILDAGLPEFLASRLIWGR